MAAEIERKFLVAGQGYRENLNGVLYRQGYLNTEPERTVRIRIIGTSGYLTVKSVTKGYTREEFEYEIPIEDAGYMLDRLCLHPLIEKIRYRVPFKGLLWEVDEFTGENEGLVIAEIELESEGQVFERPDWLGTEVTGDSRYFNSSLSLNPYLHW